MSDIRLRQFIEDWANALDRLDEALDGPTDIVAYRDSTLLSFTFVYELGWHTMQRLLYLEGVELNTPKSVVQRAYQAHWIDDEQVWLNMVDDRNLVAHTYREKTAIEIYARIRDDYAPVLRKTFNFIRQEFPQHLT